MSVKTEGSSKHQIAIPYAIRKELHLGAGDQLLAHVRDGVILLVPRRGDAVDQLQGRCRDIWEGDDAREYVERERNAWETS